MIIQVQNFVLRSISEGDSPRLFTLIERNRSRLTDYFPGTIAAVQNPKGAEEYVIDKQQKEHTKELFTFVLDNEMGQLMGMVIIKNIDWRVPKAELAYFIDESVEGRGIMTDALNEVTNFCLSHLGINKLFIITAKDNYPSRRIAEKCGFEIEGVLRKNFKMASGEIIDCLYYGKVKG